MEKVTENYHKKPKKINPARSAAVRILNKTERSGAYIDKLVDFELKNAELEKEDKGLLQELVYGVTRWKAKLDWILVGFFHGDFQKCFNYIKNAMRVGLYQLIVLDKIPDHAAIDASVEMVKRKQGKKTAGLVNGVLRNIARNKEKIRYPKKEDDYPFYISVMESHAKWMVVRWINRWGEEATIELMKANNLIPSPIIRVNTLKASVEEIKNELTSNNIEFEQSKFLDESIIIKSPLKVAQTDLFKSGKITIQDTSASLVGKLASPKEDWDVFDACAAPGGKTTHLAQIMNNKGSIKSADKFEAKIGLISENIERLGITNVDTEAIDLYEYSPKKKFDLVLLDVPCSGHGTIRHKPDIKWSSEREQITKLLKIQTKMIQKASELVKPGGVLVYSTCTIEFEENDGIIEKFLKNNPDWKLDKAQNYLDESLCTENGYMQTLPHIHNCDGAFGARLIKPE